MVFVIGIIMIGSHFLLMAGIAQFCSQNFPDWGMVLFMLAAVSSGYYLLKMQTRLEAYFIIRHLKKKPNSGWNVVAAGKPMRGKRRLA